MEAKKIPLVSWENVCKPKEYGGLGLRNASSVNKAFMVKLGWRLINEKDSLWVRVLRSKYKCGADLMPTMKERPGQLNLWKGVSSNWQYV